MKRSDGELIAKLLKKFRDVQPLLLITVYGKELADSYAVRVLETYLNNTWSTGVTFPVRVSLDDFLWNEKFPNPFGSATSALLDVRIALERQDAEFFEDLAKAIRRRKDPVQAARFKMIDYIQKHLVDLAEGKRGPIENDELKALGITNVSATTSELGLDGCFKSHEDRRGKSRKPKK